MGGPPITEICDFMQAVDIVYEFPPALEEKMEWNGPQALSDSAQWMWMNSPQPAGELIQIGYGGRQPNESHVRRQ
jgi:hypothetical protein